MTTILDSIVAAKRIEVARLKEQTPLSELETCAKEQASPLNLSGSLWGDRMRIIAEVKRASPSRGVLRADLDPVVLATTYAQNGGAAVSVLTEGPNFQGSLEHLRAIKQALLPYQLPVLRKDFIFDPYQVYESRAAGADAILLIVAILEPSQLRELLEAAQRLWLQCLVEVHNRAELEVALAAGAEVIGINNRDLRTFETSVDVTERLRPFIPQGKVVVSESGIATPQDMQRLRQARVDAALIGEALVTAPDPGAKLRELAQLPAMHDD